MKHSKAPPVPSSFFLPPTPSIREYSISFCGGNSNSSADLDYLPITHDNNPKKTTQENLKTEKKSSNYFNKSEINRSPSDKNHKTPNIDEDLKIINANNYTNTNANSNNKYKELIRNSPLDKFRNVEDYMGKELNKFINITENLESPSKKHLIKDPSNNNFSSNNLNINTFNAQKKSYQELNLRPVSAKKNPKEPMSAQDKSKNLILLTSPSQKNGIYDEGMDRKIRMSPSPQKEREIYNKEMVYAKDALKTPKKDDRQKNYGEGNNLNNLNQSPSQKSTVFEENNKNNLRNSPKMGWELGYFVAKTQDTSNVGPKVSEMNYLSSKIQDFNNQIVKTPEKTHKFNKNPYLKEPLSAQKDDRLRNSKITVDNPMITQMKSFNELNIRTITPKKDHDVNNTMSFTLENARKSARDQYKLISPENKGKISLDLLFNNNTNNTNNHSNSNAKNATDFIHNNNNNNTSCNKSSIKNNNNFLEENNRKSPINNTKNQNSLKTLSVSPGKLKHTQSFLTNEGDSNKAKPNFIKKSFDGGAFEKEKDSENRDINLIQSKVFSNFEKDFPEISLTTKKSIKINDKTDELKQMAFNLFKPKQEKAKKTENPDSSEKKNEKNNEKLDFFENSKEKDKKKDENIEIPLRKLSFGNKNLEKNVADFEEISKKTPLFYAEELNESKNIEEGKTLNRSGKTEQKGLDSMEKSHIEKQEKTIEKQEKTIEKQEKSIEKQLEKPEKIFEKRKKSRENPEKSEKLIEKSPEKPGKLEKKDQIEEVPSETKKKRTVSIKEDKVSKEKTRKKSSKKSSKELINGLDETKNQMFLPEKQRISIILTTEPSLDDKSSNSLTSIIMKRSLKLNKMKSEGNNRKNSETSDKNDENFEKIDGNIAKNEENNELNDEKKINAQKIEEEITLNSVKYTENALEGNKKRSISLKNPKEKANTMKKSIKIPNKDSTEKSKLKAPQISEKKVSFTDNKNSMETEKNSNKKTSITETEKKPNKKSINGEISNENPDKLKKLSSKNLTKSESFLIEMEKEKNSKDTKRLSKLVQDQAKRSSKQFSNGFEEKPIDNIEKDLDFSPMMKQGSRTTKNKDFVQNELEITFPKSPDNRAKSVQKDRKEVKMNFLNLNEFISTLGRGEVLPKRNSAKTPNDLHINLELLQKIAQETNNETSPSKHRKSSQNSSVSSSMHSSLVKKSVAMPEIPEKKSLKSAKLSKESTESQKITHEKVISRDSSEDYSESSSSNSSIKNIKKAPEKEMVTLSVGKKERAKLSSVSSMESDDSFTSMDTSTVIDFNSEYYMTNMRKFNKTNCKSNYFKELYCEHLLQSFKALNFCKILPEVEEEHLAKRTINLPKKESHLNKKTLIFDLDETLIHCNETIDMPSDVILAIKLGTGTVIEAGVNVRPYAVEILQDLSEEFEIIVFTASHSCYANRVLDYLDPKNEYIHHRLFRDNCVVTSDGAYVKDLRIFANRDIKDVAIVDNACYSFGYQIENGVPIIPFYHNKNDEELKHLKNYLMKFKDHDIRELNKETFKLHLYAESEDYKDIINKMFPEE